MYVFVYLDPAGRQLHLVLELHLLSICPSSKLPNLCGSYVLQQFYFPYLMALPGESLKDKATVLGDNGFVTVIKRY